MSPQDILQFAIAIVVAVACSTLVLILVGQPWRREFFAYLRNAAPAAAVGLSFVVGYFLFARRWPGFPPRDVSHWPVFFAAVVWLSAYIPMPNQKWARALLLLLGAAAVTMAILYPFRTSMGSSLRFWITACLISPALVVICLLNGALGSKSGAPGSMISLLLAGVGVSVTLTIAGSVLLGQMAGLVCAVFGPVAVAAIIWPYKMSYYGAAAGF
ncbi:MAG: hypothetical protein K1X53_12355, partial [Candidatus Sumerlaeaceae bacterium]|nr:hypothetical protein [Candidatus Sumerlaeaceae bacterium]